MEDQASKRREGDGDGVGSDRISELPESVLVHILCFLSQKEAVQTCALSKSWRHLGSTRPVIDLRGICDCLQIGKTQFCGNCFYGNNEAFLPVLDGTFQRYYHQNLPIQKLRLHLLVLDSQSISVLEKWIPVFMKPNSCVTSFRLSVCNYIHDPEQKLDSWTCLDLPSAIFKAESLENLYLHRCKISLVKNFVLRSLKKVSLKRVYIDDETLQKIISACPFVECVKLRHCNGLKTIRIANENQNLEVFKFVGGHQKSIELDVIEIDAPTLQSIHIQNCLDWKLNRNNHFPYLKSLHLLFVQLSTESFENFSCNFPLLEEFRLYYCRGFEEIRLFCPSLKHLTIDLDSSIKVDINAPNILCFKFSGGAFPTTISLTTESREWKSQITLNSEINYLDPLSRFLELNEMVKTVSQSQIYLDVSECMFFNSMQIECGISEPVLVENLEIGIDQLISNFNEIPSLFYALFQICRPRYVIASSSSWSPRYENGSHGSKIGNVPECIWEILVDERENKEYYWQQHLEEVTTESYDYGEKVWRHVQGTRLPEFSSKLSRDTLCIEMEKLVTKEFFEGAAT